MRVYLDTCCLNRLFDPSREERVRRETDAVLTVMTRIYAGAWTWIGSDILDTEVRANPNVRVRAALRAQMRWIAESITLTESELARASSLARFGIKTMDGRHLACAETGAVEVFFTTDIRLIRAARRAADALRAAVVNPYEWMEGGTAR